MSMTPEAVRAVLTEHGLPADVVITSVNDPHFEGRYTPSTDVLEIGPLAEEYTVLHEGAHAEHWGKAGVRRSSARRSQQFLTGGFLASEVYVGRRLAGVPGYPQQEWSRLKSIPRFPDTFMDMAELFSTKAEFAGWNETRLIWLPGMKLVTRTLPLLGMEAENRTYSFFKDLLPDQSFPGLMNAIVLALKELPPSDLVSTAALEPLGEHVLALLKDAGVTVNSVV